MNLGRKHMPDRYSPCVCTSEKWPMKTIERPILEEVRRIRHELVIEAGGDLPLLVKWLAKRRRLRETAGVTRTTDIEHLRSTDK